MAETAGESVLRDLVSQLVRAARSLDHSPDEQDAAERAAVYAIVAAELAPVVRASTAAVSRALMHLCGESPALGEDPDKLVVAAVRRVVVRVTVTYGPDARELELWTEAGRSGLLRKQIRHPIDWDYVPSDVRVRRLQHGEHTVTFQLIP